MNRKFIPLLCVILLLCGCKSEEMPSVTADMFEATISLATFDDPETMTVPTETLPPASEPPIPQLDDSEPLEFEVSEKDYSALIELETGFLGGNAVVGTDIEGCSGGGCVTNLSGGGSVLVEPELPASQHYSITVRASSDAPVSGGMFISGSFWGSFSLSGSGSFETVMFTNVYLSPGAQIMFSGFDGEATLDCVLIENSEEIYNTEITPAEELITPEADASAVKLYQFLRESFGRSVISGQQTTEGTNAELEEVYKTTGRYPAIRFSDLMGYSAGEDTGDAELAIEWAAQGGIVGYSWYWTMNGSCYQSKTSFDLENAVTDLDIATMNTDTIAMRAQTEEIPLEALAVTAGIDAVAEPLKKLKDAGVAVLFRPLPEAASGQFWWSRSKESYLWLYELVYDRLVLYHGLTNLIWVWNGQDAELYPGDDLCDIVSIDLYYPADSPESGRSGVNSFISAAGVTRNKLIAISECSKLPSPDELSRDRCLWSYAATWYGDYAQVGYYAESIDWIRFYNSTLVLTLDEIEYK